MNFIIVVNSAVGCINKILFTPDVGVLPLCIPHFDGKTNSNLATIKWNVNENEYVDYFVTEKAVTNYTLN